MTETVGLAFVGLEFGRQVLRTLLSGPEGGRFRLIAVCDIDPEKVAAVSRDYGVAGYTTFDPLLADPAIHAVGLFTGPAGRANLVRRIIRAGKDVVTTKPFEVDPDAARCVLEEASAVGRVVLLNSPQPELPASLQQIERWRRDYSLGRPISCRAEILISSREKADGRWLDDPNLCPVAPIFRLGIYAINDLVRLFGRVRAVQVLANRIFTERPTPDNAQLALLFENGAIGSIGANFCVENGQHYAHSLWLNFERGSITRNAHPVAYGEADTSSRLQLTTVSAGREVVIREWQAPEITGAYPWGVFHDAIAKRRISPGLVDVIVHGIEIIAAMTCAERSGATEPVHRVGDSGGALPPSGREDGAGRKTGAGS